MKTVYILGAGVDRALGLPLADGLLRELDAFAKDIGKDFSRALKDKLGGARKVAFSFEKYVANQGESFPERMLTDSMMAQIVESAMDKVTLESSSESKAISDLVRRLRAIREANEFDEGTAEAVALLAGESSEMADQTMLRFRGITLNPSPRDAVLKVFRDLQSAEGLSENERLVFNTFVAAMTNIEDLLTELFAGFYTDRATDIRKFLYVSWMLWGFMWWKSQIAQQQVSDVANFYQRLQSLSDEDSVVTFNYTSLGDLPPNRLVAFHGDCFSYIRQDRGEMIDDDERVTKAPDLKALGEFIGALEMDIDKRQVFLPAVVPPSAMKPMIHRTFVTRWAQADSLLREADMVIAVGYAFSRVDSHFNDLFRSAAEGKKVAIINPDLVGAQEAVCGLLGRTIEALTTTRMSGVEVQRSDQLLFVPVNCEDVSEEFLSSIRGGWSN